MIPYYNIAIEDDDDRAFMEALYINYHRLMYSEINKIVGNTWDTEDILQTIVIKLIDKIALLRSRSRDQLINYIISACKYTAYNFLRNQGRLRETPLEGYDNVPDTEHTGHEVELYMIKEEDLNSLAKIWPLLDSRTQCLLEGYYILEKPMVELGTDLGIKPDSVRMALTRARKKAFDYLQQQ